MSKPARLLRATEQSPHPRQQFIGAEGLDKIIISPDIQPADEACATIG